MSNTQLDVPENTVFCQIDHMIGSDPLSRTHRVHALLILMCLLITGCGGGGGESPEYSVSGKITDASGTGVPGVEIGISGTQFPGTVATSDSEGKWQADGLKGIVTVTPRLDGWFFTPSFKKVDKAADDINFTATREPQEYSISGVVSDEQGAGLADVTIKIAGEVSKEAITGADGTWGTDGLTGTVTVTPEKEGWSFAPPSREVAQADSSLNFTGTPDAGLLTVELNFLHSFPVAQEEGDFPESSATAKPSRLLADHGLDFGLINSYVPGQFIVMMDPALPRAERERILSEAGYEILDTLDVIAAHLVTPKGYALFAHQEETHHMEALQVNPAVLAVEQNQLAYALELAFPNDPYYYIIQCWHYDQIRLPQAWAVTTGSRNVRVAVLDSGVDTDHPELAANLDLENAWDFTSEGTAEDGHGHGTHVTGTIGAVTNNGAWVAGVMWEVDILPVKVLESNGKGDTWMAANGILYAAGLLNGQPDKPTNPKRAQVINMSLGTEGNSPTLEEAVRLASAAGVILVAGAGNENQPHLLYPAAYPEVIAVGATNSGWVSGEFKTPTRGSYSNYGDPNLLMAPGGAGDHLIYSTYIDGVYYGLPIASMTGTSMAAPHVTGVIGLMVANGIHHSSIRDILERTAMKIGEPYEYGHGLVNAYWAVQAVESVRVLQGLRSGNRITEVAEEMDVLLPAQGEYTMEIQAGVWQLIAWVDVNGNDRIDAGDYYAETVPGSFAPGESVFWEAELEEIGSDDDLYPIGLGALGTLTVPRR